MSTKQTAEVANEEQVDDEYGTVDEMVEPTSNEADLVAAQNAARDESEYDDTEGTVQIEGITTDDVVVDDEVENETELSDDDNPSEEDDATESGDGSQQDAESSPEFDAALLQAAGLEESEARAQFGTPEALEQAVRLWDIRAVKWAQQNNLAAAQEFPLEGRQQPQPPVQQQRPPEDQSGLITEEELELPELPDGEEWDDETVAVIQTLANHFNKKFEVAQQQFQSKLDQQGQVTQAWLEERAQETLSSYVAEFDGFVNELGKEWDDVLGKGEGSDMLRKDPSSQHIQNRVHLDAVSQQLAQGREAHGLPPLSKPQLLDRALRVAFPQNQEKTVRKQIEREVAKRGKLKTSRPGNTIRRQSTPEETAISRTEKWYSDRGLLAAAGDEFEYDEI